MILHLIISAIKKIIPYLFSFAWKIIACKRIICGLAVWQSAHQKLGQFYSKVCQHHERATQWGTSIIAALAAALKFVQLNGWTI